MHGVFVDGHLLAGTIEGAVFVVAILGGSGRIGDHVIGEVPFARNFLLAKKESTFGTEGEISLTSLLFHLA
ncbi:MAG: hypothetical protein ACI9NQ_001273 [Paracoccaceae bacterium]